MKRRGFLLMCAAPAIVRAANIMPVFLPPSWKGVIDWGLHRRFDLVGAPFMLYGAATVQGPLRMAADGLLIRDFSLDIAWDIENMVYASNVEEAVKEQVRMQPTMERYFRRKIAASLAVS